MLRSPLRFMERKDWPEDKRSVYAPEGAIPGFRAIRKSASMFGWDWGPQLPDEGIWRSVRLEAYESRMDDVRISQSISGHEGELTVGVTFVHTKPLRGFFECVLSPSADSSLIDQQGFFTAAMARSVSSSISPAVTESCMAAQTRPAFSAARRSCSGV